MLKRMIVAVMCAVVMCVGVGGAFAGWNWSGSGYSGSGYSGSGATMPVREVKVGNHRVLLPDREQTIQNLDSDRVLWFYDGVQTISTTQIDLLDAMGVQATKVVVIGDWEVKYGSNGHGVIYQAQHKVIEDLYVHGVVEKERSLKSTLMQVKPVQRSVTVSPATQPTTDD